ncbi:MAG: hypothetical protein IPO94_05930 [Saprospiraceae bacterium]|nr:hypothetical protein [Saprospiraceae bacterium]
MKIVVRWHVDRGVNLQIGSCQRATPCAWLPALAHTIPRVTSVGSADRNFDCMHHGF